MKSALSIQPTRTTRHILMSVALWSVQIILALLFLSSGIMKLVMPVEYIEAQTVIPLSGFLIKFIGTAEVAGALGLILPGLLRIQRRLTPLAACGLVILMIGATTLTVVYGQASVAIMPFVVGLLATFVAFGRWSFLASHA